MIHFRWAAWYGIHPHDRECVSPLLSTNCEAYSPVRQKISDVHLRYDHATALGTRSCTMLGKVYDTEKTYSEMGFIHHSREQRKIEETGNDKQIFVLKYSWSMHS